MTPKRYRALRTLKEQHREAIGGKALALIPGAAGAHGRRAVAPRADLFFEYFGQAIQIGAFPARRIVKVGGRDQPCFI